MSRVRQARRCRAHRSDGQPCRAWAISGGFVCRAHGGATTAARMAAERRLDHASVWRAFRAAQQRLADDTAAWQADRILTAASRLGVPAAEVTERDIRRCRFLYGVPSAPRPQMRQDRRYGRRVRYRGDRQA